MNTLEQAKAFAEFGLKVFPLNGDRESKEFKHPLTSHGHLDATTDLEIIESWSWDGCLLGVRPSCEEHSRFIIFDEDNKSEEAKSWLSEHFGTPVTIAKTNGKNKAFHYWYRYEGKGYGNKKWPYGDQIRCTNGYVIAWYPEQLLRQLETNIGDVVTHELVDKALNTKTAKTTTQSTNCGWKVGNRHSTLLKKSFLAGLHDNKEELEKTKTEALHAGKPIDEVERTAKDAWNAGKKADISEVGMCASWILLSNEKWLFGINKEEGGHWLNWTATHWQHANKLCVYDDIRKFVSDYSVKDIKKAKEIKSSRFINGIQTVGQAQQKIPLSEFDTNPTHFNTPAGIVDLETGNLIPHHFSQRVSKIAGTFLDYNLSCPIWKQALKTWTQEDQELENFLQVLAGLALRGDNREEIFAVLFGEGQNGKSKFVETLKMAMGDYAKAASKTVFKQTRHEQHPAELATLEGARLVAIPELEDGMLMNEALLKAFTGNDEISARKMRQDPRTFRPVGLPIMSCNGLPNFRDIGVSMQRRTLLIPFDAMIADADKDGDLLKKLEGELPAILAWAVTGHMNYLKTGKLVKPECVLKANQEHFCALDTVGAFFEEKVSLDTNGFVASDILYRAYQDWCPKQGLHTQSKRKLTTEFNKRFKLEKGRKENARGWHGATVVM